MTGSDTYLVKGTVIVVDGKKMGSKEVTQLLQPCIDATNEVILARAAYQKAVTAENAVYAQSQAATSGLIQGIRVMFASSPKTLAEFGLSTRKTRRDLTVDEKKAATQKAQATRAARHTMGPRQKAKVTGANGTGATASGSTATAPAATSAATTDAGNAAPSPATKSS